MNAGLAEVLNNTDDVSRPNLNHNPNTIHHIMKQLLYAGALLLAPFLAFAGGDDAPTRYQVDAKSSTITWEGTKVTGAHNGDIQISNGLITVTDGLISAATVIIDMTTINTLDLDGRRQGEPRRPPEQRRLLRRGDLPNRPVRTAQAQPAPRW